MELFEALTVYCQAWLDIVTTINRDRALYGVSLAPLQLDPLLAQPIAIKDDMAGYHVGYTQTRSDVTTPRLVCRWTSPCGTSPSTAWRR